MALLSAPVNATIVCFMQDHMAMNGRAAGYFTFLHGVDRKLYLY